MGGKNPIKEKKKKKEGRAKAKGVMSYQKVTDFVTNAMNTDSLLTDVENGGRGDGGNCPDKRGTVRKKIQTSTDIIVTCMHT